MKAVAETLGVSRSNLHDKVRRASKPRGSYRKPEDDALLPLVRRLVDERPTYGYRRITALANRELARTGEPTVNHKRVFRIMRQNGMLLARHTGRRSGRVHDGKVVVMRSNLRWCSDGFEITCWNGEIVRVAFIIDAHDREIIAWHAVAGAGISGSMVRDMMLEAVETRFAALRAPHALEWLTDNGSAYTAKADPRLRDGAQPRALLHSRPEPGIERHLRELRQNLQARLCSREPLAGRAHRASADRRMVRGLQRQPSSFRAQNALPKGVHPSPSAIADCPVKQGQLQRCGSVSSRFRST